AILGVSARKEIRRSARRLAGSTMALIGITLGVAGPVFHLLGPAYRARREIVEAAARTQCNLNLKTIAAAFRAYHRDHGRLPPSLVHDHDGRPLHSWRALLLPYLEQDALYRRFNLDEPWDSPNNLRLLDQMPSVYAHPRPVKGNDPTLTYFQVFDGPADGK